MFSSCDEIGYGANPYDPSTPVTVSEMPKITSFSPEEGETGDTITIIGINFTTATAVTFGGKDASSFEIKSDTEIEAIVGPYGGTGAVAVTNHKGTKSLNGFLYIKIEVPTENPNLALNKFATASTELTPASLGVDGETGTRWSADNEDNQWYQVDLGKVYSINNIIIKWEAAYASAYDVQVSVDNIAFSTVYSTTAYAGGDDNIKFSNTDARYVKILLHTRATPWAMSFWELEVYNTPPPVNLALNKAATASTELTPASLGVDGEIGTRWSADNEDNQWYQVDLGKVYSINNIIIKWEAAYALAYDVQVSTDNAAFTTVYSVTAYGGGDDNISIEDTDARYVKILLYTRATPWAMSFWELEIYNN
jgi:hypothetical protein